MELTDLKENPPSPQCLGAPLIIGSPKRQFFNSLLDRMHSNLAGWKSKLLSLTGRRILVKHVLSNMAIHIAIVFPLTKSVTNIMERLMRNFLWSAKASQSRINHIRWDVVCLPTSEGGPGIRHFQKQNGTSFLKLG